MSNSKIIYLKPESSISVDRVHINENFKYLDNSYTNLLDRVRVVENESGVSDNLFTNNLELGKSVFHNLSVYSISFGNGLQIGQNFLKTSTVASDDEDILNLGTFNLLVSDKQDLLESGVNIKTINNESILGSGNFELPPPTFANLTGDLIDNLVLTTEFNNKQDLLDSGVNIKTINNQSLLGSGNLELPPPVWGGITGTLSEQTDLNSALSGKENSITAGTTGQYWRGDKTFQTLDKTAVGLSNVDNTSDLNKPISTLTQTEIDTKNIFVYDNLSITPLTRRTKYRAVEFIEFIDDNTEQETKIQLRESKLTLFESDILQEVDGVLKIVGIPNKFAKFDIDGFLSAGNLINGANKTIVTDVNGDIQEIDVVNLNEYEDLLEATATENSFLDTKDEFGVSKGIPGGFKIRDLIIENTTNNEVTVSIGTADGLFDVALNVLVPANSFVDVPISKSVFSKTSEQTMWISSLNWNSSSLIVNFSIKKVF